MGDAGKPTPAPRPEPGAIIPVWYWPISQPMCAWYLATRSRPGRRRAQRSSALAIAMIMAGTLSR